MSIESLNLNSLFETLSHAEQTNDADLYLKTAQSWLNVCLTTIEKTTSRLSYTTKLSKFIPKTMRSSIYKNPIMYPQWKQKDLELLLWSGTYIYALGLHYKHQGFTKKPLHKYIETILATRRFEDTDWSWDTKLDVRNMYPIPLKDSTEPIINTDIHAWLLFLVLIKELQSNDKETANKILNILHALPVANDKNSSYSVTDSPLSTLSVDVVRNSLSDLNNLSNGYVNLSEYHEIKHTDAIDLAHMSNVECMNLMLNQFLDLTTLHAQKELLRTLLEIIETRPYVLYHTLCCAQDGDQFDADKIITNLVMSMNFTTKQKKEHTFAIYLGIPPQTAMKALLDETAYSEIPQIPLPELY